MRPLSLLLLIPIALSASACGKNKMKFPQVKMPEFKLPEGEKPEEKIQKQLAKVVKTYDDPAFFREVADLLEASRKLNWDSNQLLAQVLDYAAKVDDEQSMRQHQRILAVLDAPRSAIVAYASQRLDSMDSRNADIHRALLRNASPATTNGEADFTHFRPHIEANRNQPPEKLILWMYDRDSGAAMKLLDHLYGPGGDVRTDLLWAEQVIRQTLWSQQNGFLKPTEIPTAAREQLEKLSQSPQWWVRAYIAQVLSKNPALSDQTLLARLNTDPHPIVKTLIARS